MTAERRLAIATLGFRGAGTGGGPGTVILVDDLSIDLADPDVDIELTEGLEVDLAEPALSVELSEPSISVTLDAGFEVSLESDLEVDLG